VKWSASEAYRTRRESRFRNNSPLALLKEALLKERQRGERGERRSTRTRGENVCRARIIDVDAQAVRTSIPVAHWHRAADVRDQGRGAPRRAACHG